MLYQVTLAEHFRNDIDIGIDIGGRPYIGGSPYIIMHFKTR